MKKFALSLFAGLFLAGSLQAAPIWFNIGPSEIDGFNASVIHTATSGHIYEDGYHWYTSGSILGHLNGQLHGELTDGGLTFEAGTLSILDISGPLAAYHMEILGGEISTGDPAGGHLDYSITNGEDIFSEGTFYFPELDLGAPNQLLAGGSGPLVLWGQNFLESYDNGYYDNDCYYDDCKDDFIDLGIDLYGTPVPEPATMAMMGLGLGAAGLVQRRRKKKTA